jgi:hypothetical protein
MTYVFNLKFSFNFYDKFNVIISKIYYNMNNLNFNNVNVEYNFIL